MTHDHALRTASRPARGLTLLELIVVMAIVLMVTAAAIPMMVSGSEGRKMRETARLVNSYIAGARAPALATGRPCGVKIERFDPTPAAAGTHNLADYSMQLSYVEVPPPYGGDTSDATCTVTGTYNAMTGKVTLLAAMGSNFTPDNVHVNDIIRFNYQGGAFKITGPDIVPSPKGDGVIDSSSGTVTLELETFSLANGQTMPAAWMTSPGATVPFQIARQPVGDATRTTSAAAMMKSADAPLQLPDGIVIDLTASGMGNSSVFTAYDPANPSIYPHPTIMFYPGGAVQYLYDGTAYGPPTGPIHLLLGRREGMNDVLPTAQKLDVAANFPYDMTKLKTTKNWPNLFDLENRWVSIGYETGMISSSENGFQFGSIPDLDTARANARLNAATAQSMGGK